MFFDFDNDGWPDLLMVNGHVYPEVDKQHLGSNYQEPKILYRNNGNGTFTDISAEAGSGITNATSARGLAVGDLWNDGQLLGGDQQHECAPQSAGEPDQISRITGSPSAPSAQNPIATALARASRLQAGGRMRVDEVRSGSSYSSNSDMRVHFGLGQTDKIDFVEVRWPSGLLERFERLSVDSIHVLKEGTGSAVKAGKP